MSESFNSLSSSNLHRDDVNSDDNFYEDNLT